MTPHWLEVAAYVAIAASFLCALIFGFATSYPANWWLVKSGLKEAM